MLHLHNGDSLLLWRRTAFSRLLKKLNATKRLWRCAYSGVK